MEIFKIHQHFIELKVWVKPGSSRNAILQITEKGLALAVSAKAKEGEANLAVCKLLADFLDIPKTQIKVLKGSLGRQKIMQIPYSESVLQKISSL
jgi:uncharacterized protein (TIGR00251 family)